MQTNGIARENGHFKKPPVPVLSLMNKELEDIIISKLSDNMIVVADNYNFRSLVSIREIHKYKNLTCVLVNECCRDMIEKIKTTKVYSNVIAVGGCTALDFGRALAKSVHHTILIPSILSTNCISVNKSVVYANRYHQTIKTPVPNEIIVSFPLLLSGDQSVIHKWSSAGFGDLFGNFSAAIDYLHKTKGEYYLKCNDDSIDLLCPFATEAWDAVNWVIENFEGYDEKVLKQLAILLHNASSKHIGDLDMRLGAAGEHDLYYTMLLQQDYSRENPTHGELITIGTLLSAKILANRFGKNYLYQLLRKAYRKLKLPTDYSELKLIGVEKKHIVDAVKGLPNNDSFLRLYFEEYLLDECYGMQNGGTH